MLKDNLDYREKTAVDPQRLMTLKPPGSATFSKIDFFDREGQPEDGRLRSWSEKNLRESHCLGESSKLELGSSRKVVSGLIPMLLALGSGDHDIFETWLNFHEPRLDGSKNDHLETLPSRIGS